MSLYRPKDEGERWVQLSLVSLLLFVVMLIFMAVLPSAWLYIADSTIRRSELVTRLNVTPLQFLVFRDVVAVGIYGVVLAAAGIAVRLYNQRNPRVLPPGEDKREATGGYK